MHITSFYRYKLRTDGFRVYVVDSATDTILHTFTITKYPRFYFSNCYREDPAWRRAMQVFNKLNFED